MSQWNALHTHLLSSGFSVFSPGQHKGECLSPYIVIRLAGSSQQGTFTSNKDLYELLCYVPQSQYSTLEAYKDSVKEAMRHVYPTFVPTGFETAAYYDDTVKAHMISIEYRNMIQNKYTPTQTTQNTQE